MSFDSIPEDREPAYPCDCGGTITLTDYNDTGTVWECDSCDFKRTVKK